jgi:hypothetical protein
MKASTLGLEAMRANHAAFEQTNRVAGLLDSEPTTANREAVLQLVGGRLVPYRGRLYFAPPIPYTVGLEHQHLLEELDRLAAGETRGPPVFPHDADMVTRRMAYRLQSGETGCVRRCVRLFHRHLRPVAWWGFLPWWIRPNPFRAASAREIGELNASFLVARMT